LRTAAIEVLPFDALAGLLAGTVGHFITGTIGNPQEEHIEMTSISYSLSGHHGRRKMRRVSNGLPPVEDHTYVYLLAHADDGWAATDHLRGPCRYTLMVRRISKAD